MTDAILPGATLGVLGSGQLGRMFARAARRMGYRVAVYSPDVNSPAGQVADQEFVGAYEDLEAVRKFARECAGVTIEFENIPAETLEAVAEVTVVRPGPRSLATTQHRLREREFLTGHRFPVVPYSVVNDETSLLEAVATQGTPAVLKTAGFGYDGKGQRLMRDPGEAIPDWESVDRQQCVLERFIEFEREISVIVARGADGACATYSPFDNLHERHILDCTSWPAAIPAEVAQQAMELGEAIASALEHVGVLCIEMFLMDDGRLLINELAPRPHNSGHLTIEAATTSQFEQQVRVLCGLPLGSTALIRPAAMAQLLGDLWLDGEPDWPAALRQQGCTLHLYGKAEARPGRKMGHLTMLAASASSARKRVLAARAALTPRS